MKKIYKNKLLILITIIITIFFINPFILRRNRIEHLIKSDLPKSSKIIDYNFKYSFYGAYPIYAKIEIDQDFYTKKEIAQNDYDLNYINYITKKLNNKYDSFNCDTIDEIKYNQFMGANYFLLFCGTTKLTELIMIKEMSGNYYLYVYSY